VSSHRLDPENEDEDTQQIPLYQPEDLTVGDAHGDLEPEGQPSNEEIEEMLRHTFETEGDERTHLRVELYKRARQHIRHIQLAQRITWWSVAGTLTCVFIVGVVASIYALIYIVHSF
jgi:hypothetical protein